ncbi:hypothetical protein Dtox_2700 [Desulfofarcimen acetoxidans DSM 771]|jgi:hypothetical protein|uniref:Fimbrial assembly family protein n=1 Tax=Desulfofarcimen acetoxidans (strain ATCC 49208 / DSM 771 / KCTC 5769 / VKM B-1644 / 5575) TaxID=485916 RepID=C8W183_DESAS|nr:hypothetical protein [Desulfofarcimen acetoxidans]ACV63479.1 hypothetical protein Dtox_2700 [Desulfofarcimen acetoxidans DSM 771]
MYEVNLLRTNKRLKNFLPVPEAALRAAVIGLIFFISGVAYAGFLFSYHNLQKKSVQSSLLIEDKSALLQNMHQLRQSGPESEAAGYTIDDLVQNRITWSKLMLDLNILGSLGLRYGEMKLYTVADKTESPGRITPVIDISGEAESTMTVANLYKELCRLNYLSQVKLKSVDRIGGSQYVKFLFTAKLTRKN